MSDIFDPMAVDENVDPVAPPGIYRALIEYAETKANSKGTGRFVQVNLSLIDGQYRGYKAKAYINFEHETPATQNRGRAEFRRLMLSAGIKTAVNVNDIGAVLKNKVVTVDIDVEESAQYGRQNKAKDFVVPEGGGSSCPSAAQQDLSVPF